MLTVPEDSIRLLSKDDSNIIINSLALIKQDLERLYKSDEVNIQD